MENEWREDASRQLAERILARASAAPEEPQRLLLDNARLVRTGAKQAREFASGLQRFPLALGPSGECPRVLLIARVYLEHVHFHFSEESCAAFLTGVQEVMPLEMGEIWGLKPCIELVILESLETAGFESWAALITSARHVGETAWKDLFESVSPVDRILSADPANAYSRMVFESRDLYRNVIAGLAKHSATQRTRGG